VVALGPADRRQAFRQMLVNVAAAVRDDHTKNFRSSTKATGGAWLTHHQLTVAGSRSGAPRAGRVTTAP
jgi:hypothetical protein